MVSISVSGSFTDWIQGTDRVLRAAVTAGVRAATDGLKLELRQHVSAALGTRAAGLVTSRLYPKDGHPSMRTAGEVVPRGKAGAQILEGFTKGATIAGKNGRTWLAIPTRFVPVLGRNVKPTIEAVEAYFGRPLRWVMPGGRGGSRRVGLLVIDNSTSSRKTGRARKVFEGRAAFGQRAPRTSSIVMFVLVPQARLPKKLNPGPIAAAWARRVPELIERAMPRNS